MIRKKPATSKKNAKAETKSNTAAASGKASTPTQSPSAMDEPVPRKPSTSPVANDSPLSKPPLKQYAPRDPSAASPGVAVVSIRTAIASEQTNPSEAVAPNKYGLSDQQHIMNKKDLASVLAEVFGYDRERRKLLKKQFQEYLPKLGADNERSFAMLTDEKLWFHNSIHIAYSCVNVSVVQLLVQIADYMGTVLRRSKFLMPSVRYKSLKRFVLKGTDHPGRYDARGSDSSIVLAPQSYSEDKLPGFKIPKFHRRCFSKEDLRYLQVCQSGTVLGR